MRRNQAPLVLLPNLAGAVVAVADGFVERVLGLKQGGVCGGHELPVEQIKPRSFHRHEDVNLTDLATKSTCGCSVPVSKKCEVSTLLYYTDSSLLKKTIRQYRRFPGAPDVLREQSERRAKAKLKNYEKSTNDTEHLLG
jgi:hypothetical protein